MQPTEQDKATMAAAKAKIHCNMCGVADAGLLPIEAGTIEIRMPYFVLRSGAFNICTACGHELRDVLREWMKSLPTQLFRVASVAATKPQPGAIGGETIDLTSAVESVIKAVDAALKQEGNR
jgi:hypothetical protein